MNKLLEGKQWTKFGRVLLNVNVPKVSLVFYSIFVTLILYLSRIW